MWSRQPPTRLPPQDIRRFVNPHSYQPLHFKPPVLRHQLSSACAPASNSLGSPRACAIRYSGRPFEAHWFGPQTVALTLGLSAHHRIVEAQDSHRTDLSFVQRICNQA